MLSLALVNEAQFVNCPQCGFEVRVTDEEQRILRSFCTSCEARFDVAIDESVGAGPFRMTARIAGSWQAVAPTDRIRVTETADATLIELRPDSTVRERRGRVMAATGYLAIAGAAVASLFVTRSFDYGRGMVIFFSGGAGLKAMRDRLSRELIRIDRDGITFSRRFGRSFRIPVGALAALRPSGGGVELQAPASGIWPPPRLGDGFGCDVDTLGWLVRRIDHAIRRVRVAGRPDAPALPPAGAAGALPEAE
jgi:hypothetical protein